MLKDKEINFEEDFFSRWGDLDSLITKCWYASGGVEREFTRLMDDLYRRVKKFADRHVLNESEEQSEQVG